MARTPIPTPRRGDRTRRAPIRYGFEDDVDSQLQEHNQAENMSICSSASSVASKASSRRAAELRLRHIQEEQDLQRKHEESLRALELLRARNDLERATLEEEEIEEERRSLLSAQHSDTRQDTRHSGTRHVSPVTMNGQCREDRSIHVEGLTTDKRPMNIM